MKNVGSDFGGILVDSRRLQSRNHRTPDVLSRWLIQECRTSLPGSFSIDMKKREFNKSASQKYKIQYIDLIVVLLLVFVAKQKFLIIPFASSSFTDKLFKAYFL